MSGPSAFEACALPHLDSLYRLALQMTGQPASAEDLVQDAYTKAYRNFHRFQAGTNFKAWISTILAREYISDYRRKARGPVVTDFGGMEPAALEEPVRLSPQEVEAIGEKVGDEAKKALEIMPAEFRIVLLLVTVEEMRYREVADRLGIPIGTVMSRLFRARNFLRKQLADYARESGFRTGRSTP